MISSYDTIFVLTREKLERVIVKNKLVFVAQHSLVQLRSICGR